MSDQPTSSLDDAPDDVKLAVDLIYLFESNGIDPELALSALKIVQTDLEKKLSQKQ
ncbi:pleiotropic regulatory protein RsmS [Vibrio natriegens]|uniref:pleiotropic regulatory protein RsmS n=1 Tax=Vibrio natriegens TaxID=691 RepID=UPI0021E7616F|nr:pleiotropic regulatory protein RsmS [Vibrio natriegens]UYI48086.1 pleiotropic regulatory protein RsmS [Vibrio natriegens]